MWTLKGELKGLLDTKINITGFITIIGAKDKRDKIIFVGEDPKINIWIKCDHERKKKDAKKKISSDEKYKEHENEDLIPFHEDPEFENWKAHSKKIQFVTLTPLPDISSGNKPKQINILKLITGGDEGILRVWDGT